MWIEMHANDVALGQPNGSIPDKNKDEDDANEPGRNESATEIKGKRERKRDRKKHAENTSTQISRTEFE